MSPMGQQLPPIIPADDAGHHSAVAPGVRLAMPVEAQQIAQIQRRAWEGDALTREFLAQATLDEMAQVWHRSIVSPPLATYRVLVATEPEGAPVPQADGGTGLASRVVGFAALAPSSDEDADPATDGELSAFTVDELARGRGHSSRLLNAAADTARADGFTRLTSWVLSTDDEFRALLTESGWGPDGAHRELATEDESVSIKQVRLHTDISA